MENINLERFNTLLDFVHKHEKSKYTLFDNSGQFVDAYYDTDYESDNGLDTDENGYEEYQCILFKKSIEDTFFEVNYHNIPVKVICEEKEVY